MGRKKKDTEETAATVKEEKRKVVQVYFSGVSPLQKKLIDKIQSGDPVQVSQTSFVAKSNLLMELALIGMVTVEKLYPGQFETKEENKAEEKPDDITANRKIASKNSDALSSFGVHTS